nr:hypothetical protein [Vibrio furnissii]
MVKTVCGRLVCAAFTP